MSDSILDLAIGELHNPLIRRRAVTALMHDQGLTMLDADAQLQQAIESAYAEGSRTLSDVIDWTASEPAEFESSVRLLDRRDAAVQAAYGRAAPKLLDTDPQGRVLLDQPDGSIADIGAALTDPGERERRLARARKLDGRYDGPDGRKLFEQEDRLTLESGRDLVATLEQGAGQRVAQVKAREVAKLLDQAIAEAADKRGQLRLLDAKLAELDGGPLADTAELGREQLRAELAGTDRKALLLLDQVDSGAPIKLLDRKPPLPAMDATAILESLRARRETLKPEERTLLYTLEQKTAPGNAPAAADPPAGVHPGSHELDTRIRERMRKLDRPESAYLMTLNELMAEDR